MPKLMTDQSDDIVLRKRKDSFYKDNLRVSADRAESDISVGARLYGRTDLVDECTRNTSPPQCPLEGVAFLSKEFEEVFPCHLRRVASTAHSGRLFRTTTIAIDCFDAATKIFRKSHVGFLDMRARFVMFPSFRKIENNVAINTYTLNGAICHEDEMISI